MNKYKEHYIESLKSQRFMGVVFVIGVILLTIFVWICGVKELWPLKNKIILTIVGGFIAYGFGYSKIKKANKELKEVGGKRKMKIKKYKEYYTGRFVGWVLVILTTLVVIAIWIFGTSELWPLKNKIILTILGGIFAYIVYELVKKANKELKEVGEENEK